MPNDIVDEYLSKVAAVVDAVDTKGVRRVRDAAFWGKPVGTPIKPGDKPVGSRKPTSRARAAVAKTPDVTPSGKPAPKRRVNVRKAATNKPTSPTSSDSARKMFNSTADKDSIAAAKELEKQGYRWSEDPDNPGVWGLTAPNSNRAAAVIHDDGTVEMNDDVIAGALDKPKTPSKPKRPGQKMPKPKESDVADVSVRRADEFSVEDAAKELKKIKRDGRPDGAGTMEDPVDVGDDVEAAAKALSEGKHIRMETHVGLSSLLDKINEMARDAKEKGDRAPEYDLCKVSIPGTNLFCIESKGIPRTAMPQFKGDAIAGSFAATKRNEKGEANVEPQFRELLDAMGIEHKVGHMPAANLKASQENLDGVKVAGMMQAIKDGKMPQAVLDQPIFVTKDGYIVDGHHRWAALVALDMEDGVAGDIPIPVEVIDGDIGYTLDLANGFADMAGIKRKGLGANANAVKAADLMAEYADFRSRCCD